MDIEIEINRSIEWPVECAFKKLTSDGADLYTESFDCIKNKTIENHEFLTLLSEKINLSTESIQKYFLRTNFIYRLIKSSVKNIFYVSIIMTNNELFTECINYGYEIDPISVKLACINSKDEIFLRKMYEISPKTILDTSFLAVSLENNNICAYNFLLEIGCKPMINILNVAVKMTNESALNVVKSLNEDFAPNEQTIKEAIMYGRTDVILYILERYFEVKKHFDKNLIAYLLMNSKMEIIKYLDEKKLINWHIDLYYSAILSGSIDFVKYINNFYKNIDDIHAKKILDKPITQSTGRNTILTNDIIYKKNNVKYFSHTMNYAIQSNNIDMVKYVYSLGYGISGSNIITAIKSNTEIFELIINIYDGIVPPYLLCYFSLNSLVEDKTLKLNILIKSAKINLFPSVNSDFYRLESQHIDLINKTNTVDVKSMYNAEYLFNYVSALGEYPGIKFNHRLYVISSYAIINNDVGMLKKILKTYLKEYDKQLIKNIIVVYAANYQSLNSMIDVYLAEYPYEKFKISRSVWPLLISFGSIEKIIVCKIHNEIDDIIYQTIALNNNKSLLKLFDKYKVDINTDKILSIADDAILLENLNKIPLNVKSINKILALECKEIIILMKNNILINIEDHIKYCIDHKLMYSLSILNSLKNIE